MKPIFLELRHELPLSELAKLVLTFHIAEFDDK